MGTLTPRRPRVLLVWPGTEGAAAGNFGVPQLVLLATYARQKTGAEVRILDLVAERALGPISLERELAGWDVIGFSVYSSFDWLKCEAMARIARVQSPDAVIVAGGYHASARPLSIVRDGSPFDVCVVGEGEKPLVQIIESVAGGAPMRQSVIGPDPVEDLAELPPSDWSLLDRYKGVARRVASQTQVYLSRGCPFDCAFCMERAKREVSWRPLPVERAVEEVERLHRWLDLSTWTLYVADALFGMKKSWRRAFLEELARRRLPVRKIWLLIRVDLVEDEDLRLFADANCGLGFGLESGDPALLATIRKAGRLEDYLERMDHVAAWARERDVPWGANVICGHPGETRASLERSAAYLRQLFLDPKGTTGFLSVDAFRLYPGSPIDTERASWQERYGARFHRPEWWEDGDQEFLAEWVDPSHELDWLAREELQHRLLGPVLAEIESKFVYRGPAREYFLRAVRDQAELSTPRVRHHYLDRYFAWQKWLGRAKRAEPERASSSALREVAAAMRAPALAEVARRAGIEVDAPVMRAIASVPRERFVPLDQIAAASRDVAIALDRSGEATVSAMHAYARAFTLLEVCRGDRVLDLGAGTGYGSAILRELVGPGAVHAVELDPALVAAAKRVAPDLDIVTGDARDPASWPVAPDAIDAIYAGFALDEIPPSWLAALRPGTRIVAPVVTAGDDQRLAHHVVGGATVLHEPVRYVRARSAVSPPAPPPAAPAPTIRRLRVT